MCNIFMAQQSPLGQGPLIIEASPSRLDTPHSVEPLWTSDQPSAQRTEVYLTTHNTHKTDIHAPGGIWTHNPSKRAALDPRLRLRGRWVRQD